MAHETEARRGVTANAGNLKARVERAALELFAREGVDAVSIKSVAGAAGISDGAMYRYYKSKDALAVALFETIHVRLYNLLECALAEAYGFEDAVRRVVRVYCEAADDDPDLFAYHLTHMHRFGVEARPGCPDPVGLIAGRLKGAMEAGDLPQGDPEIKAAAALGVVLQPTAHRMVGRFDVQMTTMADRLADAALLVLRTV
ncbi:TetR/AcrR family transcriptional regulator [Marinicauda sp. Alg238-R41]|uniref:TetR/AcrR family transcriptional regulator n=1 Tax=Marinicauda sp. Alg238-R41 TaxID=2993447 RepID=UPI0022E3E61A|nr:TetR/AcrR family transcriptional regulator [Marinicauda sp. Alg238-R41]